MQNSRYVKEASHLSGELGRDTKILTVYKQGCGDCQRFDPIYTAIATANKELPFFIMNIHPEDHTFNRAWYTEHVVQQFQKWESGKNRQPIIRVPQLVILKEGTPVHFPLIEPTSEPYARSTTEQYLLHNLKLPGLKRELPITHVFEYDTQGTIIADYNPSAINPEHIYLVQPKSDNVVTDKANGVDTLLDVPSTILEQGASIVLDLSKITLDSAVFEKLRTKVLRSDFSDKGFFFVGLQNVESVAKAIPSQHIAKDAHEALEKLVSK